MQKVREREREKRKDHNVRKIYNCRQILYQIRFRLGSLSNSCYPHVSESTYRQQSRDKRRRERENYESIYELERVSRILTLFQVKA